ncbi:MAG: hypothetical protein WAU47_03585 [Desulfobaccales bacterium]
MNETEKIALIKNKVGQGMKDLSQEEVTWLITRLEELLKQNDFLKTELSYVEHQGEVGY